jgi:hypothetical protein
MPNPTSNLSSVLTEGSDAPFTSITAESITATVDPLPNVQEAEEITTKPHSGRYRVYPHRPSVDPDADVSKSNICNAPTFDIPDPDKSGWFMGITCSVAGIVTSNIYAPFANATQFLFYSQYRSGGQKSNTDFNAMVEVVSLPEFRQEDLAGFSAEKGDVLLDKDPTFALEDGWDTADVQIPVPCKGHQPTESKAPKFTVHGLHYRRIISTITSAFQSSAFFSMHLTPFKQFIQCANGTWERAYSELYNSNAFHDEHLKIRRNFKSKTNLETVIAGIMLWSDSTHLTSFGSASLWPIYLFLGNQSKYVRSRPTSFSAHHLAYIPSVSIDFIT